MSIELLLTICVGFILLLLGIIFFIPSEKRGKKMKKRHQEEIIQKNKDLQQQVAKLERHIRSMRDRILSLQNDIKASEKPLMVEKVKVKKLQEKLSQEREWHKKESNTVDKREKEFHQLKAELGKVQEGFSKEHALTIRLEREIKGLKEQNDSFIEQRRAMESENARLKAKEEDSRKEIIHLKKEVAQLSKKNEDVQWIAKTEYDRVAKLLEEKQKELNRIERESQK